MALASWQTALDDGRSSSDARVGYRIPEIRPGLLPLLLRTSDQDGPAQASDEGSPAVASPTALHGRRWRKTRFTVLGGAVPPVLASDGWCLRIRLPSARPHGRSPRGTLPFPGDGGGDDSAPFAACDELAVATAEAQLRLPGDVAHRLRQIACAVEQRSTHPGAEAVGPRTFDENPPGPALAGLGDPAASHRAGGALRGKPQVAHNLPRVSNRRRSPTSAVIVTALM